MTSFLLGKYFGRNLLTPQVHHFPYYNRSRWKFDWISKEKVRVQVAVRLFAWMGRGFRSHGGGEFDFVQKI